ncbi:MAG: hypothetical protein ABMB14_28500 [Myxococcota bacterium]
MLLFLAGSAWAACPASSADLLAALEDAEAGFGNLDLDLFRVASDTAAADVACLAETLPRPLIARLHRVQGLRAFVDDDPVAAAAAFASARAIEPNYQFPEALVPAGHPVRERYFTQDPASGGDQDLLPPIDGQIEVDGRPGADLPRTRPSVVQWIRADGAVPESHYLRPGAAMFEYPPAVVGPVEALTETPRERRARPSVPMAIGAGVLLAAAAGSYAVAADARHDYFADDVDPDQLEPLRSKTAAFFYGAVGAGSAGAALGLGAVLVGKW